MFNAVIFDWDGTLADTKLVVVTSFQRVLKKIGCTVNDNFIERRMGIGTTHTFIEALEATNIPFNNQLIGELVWKKLAIQLSMTNKVNLFEGALNLLESLHSKKKIALASMGNRLVIDKLLEEKELRRYFEIVLTADEVLNPKPNPEIFVECAKRLRCSPTNCIVIEDSIFGISAAKQARMKCIAIPSGAYSRKELADVHPDLIVESLKENEKILSFLQIS